MAAKQALRCVRYHAARPSRPLTAPTRCRTPCGSGLCPRMSRRGGSGTTRRALRGQSPLPQLGRHSPQVRQFFLWERAEPAPTIGAIFPQVGPFFLWEWTEPAPTIGTIFPPGASVFSVGVGRARSHNWDDISPGGSVFSVGVDRACSHNWGDISPRWVRFFCGSGQSLLPQFGRVFPQVRQFFLWERALPANGPPRCTEHCTARPLRPVTMWRKITISSHVRAPAAETLGTTVNGATRWPPSGARPQSDLLPDSAAASPALRPAFAPSCPGTSSVHELEIQP